MRAVLTRVNSASVSIDGEVVGKIGRGFLILLGVGPNDTEKECRYLAEKALGLRVFRDENDKMNLGLDAIGGEVLVVSQFTLYGNCRKGRRPSFAEAAGAELGEQLYEKFLSICEELGYPPQHGRFGAYMQVESVNDGPVTLILDTDQLMDTPSRSITTCCLLDSRTRKPPSDEGGGPKDRKERKTTPQSKIKDF